VATADVMAAREIDEALAFHLESAVIDQHSDIPIHLQQEHRRGEQDVFVRQHLPALERGGVRAIVGAVGQDPDPREDPARTLADALEAIDVLDREAECSQGRLFVCRDLARFGTAAIREPARSAPAPWGCEVLICLEGGASLLGRLAVLRTLYRLGLRVLVVTWNFRNLLADGCGEERTGGGLTRFGLAVVEESNRLGIMLDMSHLSKAGMRDVLQSSRSAVVVSHAGAAAVTPHPRNLTDGEIRAVAERGGVVGIAFHPSFLGGRTVEHAVAHVLHVYRVAGAEGVGIGADYVDYFGDAVASRLALSPVNYGSEHRYPEGMETIAGLPLLTASLRARGVPDDDLRRLLGRNFQRVCGDVARAASGAV
jgi:membrane dipeptidase